MAQIVVSSKTTSSITVYVGSLDTNYSRDGRKVDWYLDGKWKKQITLDAYVSKSDTVTFSGLSAETTYEIKALIYEAESASELFAELTKNVTTNAETPTITRPSKFSWTNSIVKQGEDAIIYATEWNELTGNINEVRAYRKAKGYTVSTPTQYSFTAAVRGNDLTADMFNEVLEAISGISGYGTWFREFSKGEDCTADLLNSVVTELNTIP